MEKTDLRLGKVNYSNVAYEYILKGILSQQFQPGTPLRPETIAESVNLSPTPIKQALARLAGEGLVDLRAGQCPRVASPARDEILEMYDLRAVLETHALRQGMQRVDERFVVRMDALLGELEASIAARGSDYESRRRTADADMEIHHHIMSLWPNKRVQAWYRQLNVLLRPFSLAPVTDSHMDHSLTVHRSIGDAIKARDAARACELLREHIASASRTYLEALDAESEQVRMQA